MQTKKISALTGIVVTSALALSVGACTNSGSPTDTSKSANQPAISGSQTAPVDAHSSPAPVDRPNQPGQTGPADSNVSNTGTPSSGAGYGSGNDTTGSTGTTGQGTPDSGSSQGSSSGSTSGMGR